MAGDEPARAAGQDGPAADWRGLQGARPIVGTRQEARRREEYLAPVTTLERMNPLDAWFLYAEEDGVNHMNILSFIVLDGPPPPYEDLLELVASKLPQLPRYRQVIRTVPLHIGRPVWVDDANFDLQFHVRQTALPAPGDDTCSSG